MYPKVIYELLPYMYAFIGLHALMNLNHELGQASGLILITAGALVGYWRFSYRRNSLITG